MPRYVADLLRVCWFEVLRGSCRPQCKQDISRSLKAVPTASHAWCHFEQVGHDSFIHPPQTLLCNNNLHSIEDTFVLVAHSRHGVDLKASAKHVAGIC